MPGKITFEVIKGALAGKTFVYGETTRVFIGRQEDCGIVVPENTVSRYHCVLEITPSGVKMQDFGSLNGTFLNGVKVGQRERSQTREDAKDEAREEFLLKNGDILGLGSRCELKLTVAEPERCAVCEAELPAGYGDGETVPEDAPLPRFQADGRRVCEDCYLKEEQARLEKEIAGKKAKEEAERKKAAAARNAAEKAEKERLAAGKAEKERVEAEKAAAGRQEAERQRLAAEKAAAECREAERWARELAGQLAAKNQQKACAGCGKQFTPTSADNTLCPGCLADRAKIIDAALRAILGAPMGPRPAVQAAGPSPVKGYEKIKLLGKGGMGEVWKVRDTNTGKFYALKTMLPQVQADQTAKALFLREAELGKYLRHKNVVGAYQAGSANGIFYILMDLCEGGSADALMAKKGGKLSLTLATYIILQVLSGLAYVHSAETKAAIWRGPFKGTKEAHGIVHRDFKPGNIFLSDTSDTPVALVADFGMAKAFDTAGLSKLTKTGMARGTPVFMPRQQAIDSKFAKPEVDVWAAAASYYNMLTGALPKNFRPGKNYWQIIVTEAAVPIRQRDANIPVKLAAVIDKGLQELPSIGYTSAAALRRDIVSALPDDVKGAVKKVIQ